MGGKKNKNKAKKTTTTTPKAADKEGPSINFDAEADTVGKDDSKN